MTLGAKLQPLIRHLLCFLKILALPGLFDYVLALLYRSVAGLGVGGPFQALGRARIMIEGDFTAGVFMVLSPALMSISHAFIMVAGVRYAAYAGHSVPWIAGNIRPVLFLYVAAFALSKTGMLTLLLIQSMLAGLILAKSTSNLVWVWSSLLLLAAGSIPAFWLLRRLIFHIISLSSHPGERVKPSSLPRVFWRELNIYFGLYLVLLMGFLFLALKNGEFLRNNLGWFYVQDAFLLLFSIACGQLFRRHFLVNTSS